MRDERGNSFTYAGGYNRSLSDFLEILKRNETGVVTWMETKGWEPRVVFYWDTPQSFSPQEVVDYIERRKLLTDCFNHFESRWQTFSGGDEQQHYFDISIFGYPSGEYKEYFMPEKQLKHKITIDCLLTK